MTEGEFKKRLCDKAFKTTWHSELMTSSLDSILFDEALELIDEAKKEMGQKLCEYCEMQEWSCNNSKDCPRNIAIKKWFGT